jgi:hypothetical protein
MTACVSLVGDDANEMFYRFCTDNLLLMLLTTSETF